MGVGARDPAAVPGVQEGLLVQGQVLDYAGLSSSLRLGAHPRTVKCNILDHNPLMVQYMGV
jgi:hypothetical protein